MNRIPLTLPLVGEEELDGVRTTLLSGWLTQGPGVKLFEEQFAAYTGAAFACAVSSCTTALHLALLAAGVKPGDVVITVSHSFIATANAIRHSQAEPVFIDIDPDTFNMDPVALEKCLNEDFEEKNGQLWYRYVERFSCGESPLRGRTYPLGRLAAILVVHQVGMPADLRAITAITRRYHLPLIEDAACAIGSEINLGDRHTWEKIGKPHGDIACFSFHPRKLLTTGDGGMLVTNNETYDRMFRLYRHHGMTLSDQERHVADDVLFEEYAVTGYNYRMTDIQAAIGIQQLRRIPDIIQQRRQWAEEYARRLQQQKHALVPVEPEYSRTNWQSYVIRLDPRIDQKHAMRRLKQDGIDVRRGVMCAHLEKPYAAAWPRGCLPHSEQARNHCIILPLYAQMHLQDIKRVVTAVGALA